MKLRSTIGTVKLALAAVLLPIVYVALMMALLQNVERKDAPKDVPQGSAGSNSSSSESGQNKCPP